LASRHDDTSSTLIWKGPRTSNNCCACSDNRTFGERAITPKVDAIPAIARSTSPYNSPRTACVKSYTLSIAIAPPPDCLLGTEIFTMSRAAVERVHGV
jgi:hypothetical protein